MDNNVFLSNIVDSRRFRLNFSFNRKIYIPEFVIESLKKAALIDFDLNVDCVINMHPLVDLGYVQKPVKWPYGCSYGQPWMYGFVGYSEKAFKSGAIREYLEQATKNELVSFYVAYIPFATRYGKANASGFKDDLHPNLVTHKVRFLEVVTVDNRTGGFIDVV